MQAIRGIELKQYIANGFVRSGVSYFGYAIILGVITSALGYGAYLMHQQNVMLRSGGFNQVIEFILLIGVGILALLTLSLCYTGIKAFRQFKRFMMAKEVNLALSDMQEDCMPIGIALDYLKDDEIIYENRHIIITNHHVIVLEGEPCIQPRGALKAAYINFHDLDASKQTKLYELKTVALVFGQQDVKKVVCHYIEEAKDILNALNDQGVQVYHGMDSYEKNKITC